MPIVGEVERELASILVPRTEVISGSVVLAEVYYAYGGLLPRIALRVGVEATCSVNRLEARGAKNAHLVLASAML